MSFNPVPTLLKEPINLKPWTKPDGKPRCTTRPRWLCPKCGEYANGGGIKKHRETCGKEAEK